MYFHLSARVRPLHPCAPAFLQMALLYSLDDTHHVTRTLVEVAGAANLQDEKVARLLAQWATSSPHARHQFAEATRIADPAFHRERVQAAVTFEEIEVRSQTPRFDFELLLFQLTF